MNLAIETMKKHNSIRKYKNDPVDEKIIDELLDVARFAPSSLNGQQRAVIVVKDEIKKRKIEKICEDMPWIIECPVFFVFIMDFYKTKLACEKNGSNQIITDSVESIMAGCVDVGLSMQNVITAAESLGLGTVCIGSIRNNPAEMIELLDLPQYTYPVSGLCIGYPDEDPMQKPKSPMESFAHCENYGTEKIKDAIDKYDEIMPRYLKSVDREFEKNWSHHLSQFYSTVYFPKVYETLKKQGFKNNK